MTFVFLGFAKQNRLIITELISFEVLLPLVRIIFIWVIQLDRSAVCFENYQNANEHNNSTFSMRLVHTVFQMTYYWNHKGKMPNRLKIRQVAPSHQSRVLSDVISINCSLASITLLNAWLSKKTGYHLVNGMKRTVNSTILKSWKLDVTVSFQVSIAHSLFQNYHYDGIQSSWFKGGLCFINLPS